MTIEQAIKKAIEGGWKKGWRFDHVDRVFVYMEKVDADCKQPIVAWMIERPLLDPQFWQSLGKALGWNVEYKQKQEPKLVRGLKQGRTTDYLISGWLYQWHKFIDHLAEGKTIESYFETL